MTGVNMENKFIYVFSLQDRDKLIKLGYKLIRSDESKNIYTFSNLNNDGVMVFSANDIKYIMSDTLTF